MSDNRANIEITASSRRLATALSGASRTVKNWAASAARGVQGQFSKIKMGEVGKNALGHVGGELMSRGMDAIVDTAQNVRDFERSLIRFQIASGGTAASTAKLREQIRGISRETGISTDEILAGAAQYVGLTGDTEGATQAMSAFARIAQASGSTVSDVAQATAALRTSMGLNASDIEGAFSGMITQGKAGAIELKDLAGELANLAPQFAANFKGGKSVAGLREMGAAFQVFRTGAGSAAEASVQFQRLMDEVAKPETARKLALLKINVFDKTGKMREASEIFEDIAKNQKLLDPKILGTVFTESNARKGVRSLQQHIDMYRNLRAAAEDTGAVQRDLNTYLESDAGRLDTAMNNIKVTIAEAFTPERIKAFTEAVEALSNKMGTVVDSVTKIANIAFGNEFGLGKLVGEVFGGGNGNPFGDNLVQRNMDQMMVENADKLSKTEQGRKDLALAQNRIADREGFNTTADQIMAAQKGSGRTTKESLAIAAAKYITGNNTGEETAARGYLVAAGKKTASGNVDIEAVRAIVLQTLGDALGATGKDIGKAFAQQMAGALGQFLPGITLNLGKDKVVNAVDTSTANRNNPA
jgi:TP901 family phage tail tape measure protein